MPGQLIPYITNFMVLEPCEKGIGVEGFVVDDAAVFERDNKYVYRIGIGR